MYRACIASSDGRRVHVAARRYGNAECDDTTKAHPLRSQSHYLADEIAIQTVEGMVGGAALCIVYLYCFKTSREVCHTGAWQFAHGYFATSVDTSGN